MEGVLFPDISDKYEVAEDESLSTCSSSKEATQNKPKVDVFVGLPKEVKENTKVKEFISAFEDALSYIDSDLNDFNLFTLSEYSEQAITLEWIYNYFRTIVSFDKEGDMYGCVLSNTIDHIYKTESKALLPGKYDEAAREILHFVLQSL